MQNVVQQAPPGSETVLFGVNASSPSSSRRRTEPRSTGLPAAITRNELAGVDDHAEPIADAGEAISWFTGQQAVLHAVLELAEESGMDAHAEQLAWAMAAYHDRRG